MRILITGGAGFLGRAILRAIDAGEWDDVDGVTVYSRDETKQHDLRRQFPDVRCVLGDVRDADLLVPTMVGHDLVIHAAAVKYIPEAEANVRETVGVNVGGSQVVLSGAATAGAETIVAISTDKACEPVNTYGLTKGVMERLVAEHHGRDLRAVAVRYGNVIGSTGSVVPLFLRQYSEGRITVTDPAMTRFWMTAAEAVATIRWAIEDTRAYSGLYIPRTRALTMGQVANAISTERGWDEIGERPGEKMHEQLVGYQESARSMGTPDDAGTPGFVLRPASDGPVHRERFIYSSQDAVVSETAWFTREVQALTELGEL